ncbi:M6 family metalloprotease domain-containing protein [Actinokineospora auranticolor]|uniref:M6 family metalloprotease-like protein n=1 Tax=Actinokineospora auranticolor TaxID=155976 RepID=A0A2S6GPG4_9PSEU|nr:M6 family metalloprotease domain-containing protein [Actinokineospora auranticolor]PPK67086.1 M6 family metalloprotease-like protein [Actinokineospora auranticolor]
MYLAQVRRRPLLLIGALLSTATLFSMSGNAIAAPPAPLEHQWQYDHWPQQQPWQQARDGARVTALDGLPGPIDPQNWVNPDHMTWERDYREIPGTNWADPAVKGSKRTFKGALVLLDYRNQPFVVTQPAHSTVFGNPGTEAHDIPRAQVGQFYQDFLNKPGALNRGHTVHEYWMENSGGRFGVDLKAFGPYTVPGKDHEYGMEFQSGTACPSGDRCTRDLRADGRAAWVAAAGSQVPAGFDFVYYLSAGQDETSTWQEFGPIKFATKADVPKAFGSPDPALPNWARTRYVDWTSWASASTLWPNAVSGSSTQAESSGQGVFAHELTHILGIGDNYGNPFGTPQRRDYSGIWDMLSRGAFNGPGGPHSRWVVPATAGASMGSQHTLRNKLKLGFLDEANVLRLSRDALAKSGVVIAQVTAREAQAGKTGLSGINIVLDRGDLSTRCDIRTNPYCDGGGYQNYTVEVVDRMGSDSFTPDSGVLLAKTKNTDEAPFTWVVDANPQDIGMTDYVLPNGTKVPITLGDYRQLSDALFHAGTNSGSQYEYVDQANRLHFYILDIKRDDKGILSYTVAIRSLSGAGPQKRGVQVQSTSANPAPDGVATCAFPLSNTGTGAKPAGQHPEDVSAYLNGDVYRVTAKTDNSEWTVAVPNALTTAQFGETVRVPVHAKRNSGSGQTTVTFTATSESNTTATATTTCTING